MIRPPMALVGLAAAAGFVLFHIAFQVSALEDRLSRLNASIRTDREALHVLRAEWSHLNQPGRLAELSARYLDMRPMTVASVGSLEDVPDRQTEYVWPLPVARGALSLPSVKPLPPPRFLARSSPAPSKPELPVPALTQPRPQWNFDELLVQILQPAGHGT